MRVRHLVLAATALCAAGVDCTSLLDLQPPPSPSDGGTSADSSTGGDAPSADAPSADAPSADAPSADAPGSDAPLADAPAGDSASESGVDSGASDTGLDGPAVCSGPILYVSTANGSDSNPGCSPSAPKQTITAALAAGKTAGTVTSIEVCAGTYKENPLVLDYAASLTGSYDCSSWQRPSGYGYPTFGATDQTTIENAAPTLSTATLAVSGSVIGSSVVIDGFTITGASPGPPTDTAVALQVHNSAAPTVSNNQLVGGSATVPGNIGSIGLQLLSGANPTITKNLINGGSGVGTTGIGSLGLYTDGSSTSVQIIGNTINGGSGSVGGSAAVHLNGSSTPGPVYLLQSNVISAGTGTSTGSATPATTGVYIAGTSSATLDSNSIDGGGGSTGGVCGWAVTAASSGTLRITANRIYGGSCSVSASSAPYGVVLDTPVTSAVVYNNMIHAGTSSSSATSAAIAVDGAVGTDIRHNTLVGGPTAGAVPAALWLKGPTSGTTVANNVLTGAGSDVGFFLGVCPDAGSLGVTSFENNFIFGTSQGLFKWNGCLTTAYTTIDAMTAELQSIGTTVQGNVTAASSCATSDGGTDSGCVPVAQCTSPQSCLTTLFADWDVPSLGYANLFSPATAFTGSCPFKSLPPPGNGWTFTTTTPLPPCRATTSTLDDTAITGLSVDLYGNCRSSTTPSMGAEEDSTGPCQ